MTIPLIAIIVPVYNAEKYLNRCVDSIIAQTFTILCVFSKRYKMLSFFHK